MINIGPEHTAVGPQRSLCVQTTLRLFGRADDNRYRDDLDKNAFAVGEAAFFSGGTF